MPVPADVPVDELPVVPGEVAPGAVDDEPVPLSVPGVAAFGVVVPALLSVLGATALGVVVPVPLLMSGAVVFGVVTDPVSVLGAALPGTVVPVPAPLFAGTAPPPSKGPVPGTEF